MFANERYSIIINRLMKKGAVTVSKLAEDLNVSNETIRRDLLFLEQNGKLKRVFGGTVKLNEMKSFSDLKNRLNENMDLKQKLSECAVRLLKDGDIIAVDAGSTASAFIEQINGRFRNLTVITNSLAVSYTHPRCV